MKVYTLSSFAKTANGGNPAGVVLNADDLTDQQMMMISEKVGFSETAFVQKSNTADFKVKFFTPTDEVDLCGHATIATYSLMSENKLIKSGNYRQETKAGILGIEVMENGTVFMEQTLPDFYEELSREEIAESLNIPIDNFEEQFPIQIVSTGLKDVLVPIKSLDLLFGIKPDMDKVAAISKKYGTIGYHLFTKESKFSSTAHCRNLAPLYGIPEESATGTSNGALSCYLFKYGKIGGDKLSNLVFEQGYSMNKPSEILAKLEVTNNEITSVKVGGKAIVMKEIEIEV